MIMPKSVTAGARVRTAQVVFAVSASAVALLTVLPPTGWMVREQMRGRISGAERFRDVWHSLPVNGADDTDSALSGAAARLPDDLEIQVAAAAQAPQRSPDKSKFETTANLLWEQRARFVKEPAFCAMYLRSAWGASPQVGRDAEQLYSTAATRAEAEAQAKREWNEMRAKPRWKSDPAFAARALEMADQGARLEPDNAVFPFTKAAILFALNRDREAYGALHTAAQCARWEEYVSVEGRGRLRLDAYAYGTQGAMSRVSEAASLLFPQYASLRGAARIAVADAIALEETGDVQRGFQIRHDLFRVGALMRHGSTTNIGALVGIAITGVATARPGGALPIKSRRLETSQQRTARSDHQYTEYLMHIGARDEARWVEQECSLRNRARAIISRMDAGWFSAPELRRLILWWVAGILLLVNAFYLLVGGGIARVIAARHMHREIARLSRPARAAFVTLAAGPLLGGLVNTGAMVMGGDDGTLVVLNIVAGALVVAAPLVWLWRNPTGSGQEHSRAIQRMRFRQGAKIYAMTFGLTTSVLGLIVAVTLHLLQSPLSALVALDMMSGSPVENLPSHAEERMWLALLSLLAPLLTAAVGAVRGRVRGVPAQVGIVRALRQAALPGAALCLVVYGAVALVTLGEERAVWRQIDASIAHEGWYMADLVGDTWPGAVPAPPATTTDTRQPR